LVDIKGISRIVTLPDYQGLGLAMIMAERLGAAYKALGYRFRNYPAHPSFVRSHDRSPLWAMMKKPGFSSINGNKSTLTAKIGGRPCAVFEYAGPAAADKKAACSLIRLGNAE
jgi:hypothetical protein